MRRAWVQIPPAHLFIDMKKEDDDMRCMMCKEEITPKNNGMQITPLGSSIRMYQCDDCHYIEYGYRIWGSNLIF